MQCDLISLEDEDDALFVFESVGCDGDPTLAVFGISETRMIGIEISSVFHRLRCEHVKIGQLSGKPRN